MNLAPWQTNKTKKKIYCLVLRVKQRTIAIIMKGGLREKEKGNSFECNNNNNNNNGVYYY